MFSLLRNFGKQENTQNLLLLFAVFKNISYSMTCDESIAAFFLPFYPTQALRVALAVVVEEIFFRKLNILPFETWFL